MSRIGVKPIPVPKAVQVEVGNGNAVRVKGPKGELSSTFAPVLSITQDGDILKVERPNDDRDVKALQIQGVGYRAAMEGKTLVLNVGYSHPVKLVPADGITFAVEGTNRVSVTGINKQVVGEEAARIRGVRPPEPYKGKGIRYQGEYVRRKAGKTGKAK
jgi:large subunit ribosomal protein L6